MRKFRFGLKLFLALTLVGAFFVAVVTLANSNKVYADEGTEFAEQNQDAIMDLYNRKRDEGMTASEAGSFISTY